MAAKKSFGKETFHLDRSLSPNRERSDLVGCAVRFRRAYSRTSSKRCCPIGRLPTEEHRWRKGHRRGKAGCIAGRDNRGSAYSDPTTRTMYTVKPGIRRLWHAALRVE